MTDHAPRNENQNRLRIGFTILVVCAAVFIGLYFVQKRETILPVSKPAVEDGKATTGAEAGSAEASPANGGEKGQHIVRMPLLKNPPPQL